MAQVFLTRRALVKYLNERGLPIGMGQLEKLCWRGEGPAEAGEWGNRKIYTPDEADDWLMKRLQGDAS
jgi:hypothetical protein